MKINGQELSSFSAHLVRVEGFGLLEARSLRSTTWIAESGIQIHDVPRTFEARKIHLTIAFRELGSDTAKDKWEAFRAIIHSSGSRIEHEGLIYDIDVLKERETDIITDQLCVVEYELIEALPIKNIYKATGAFTLAISNAFSPLLVCDGEQRVRVLTSYSKTYTAETQVAVCGTFDGVTIVAKDKGAIISPLKKIRQ